MIVRTWRGRASLSRPDDYVRHFRTNVVAELTSVDGFLGATLVRQVRLEDIEFLVISRWRSLDAVRGFAGNAIGRAVVEPGAIAALLSYDDFAEHYEVIEEVAPA
jgi:heme-degrading monooxygenase HmoA